MSDNLRVFLRWLLYVAIAYAALFLGAGFTEKQSGVLAVSLVALFQSLKKSEPFRPYRVHIKLFQQLLDDHVPDLKEENNQGTDAKDEHWILRDGLTVVVLGPDLIYSEDTHIFFSGFNFALDFDPPGSKRGRFHYGPYLSIKPDIATNGRYGVIRFEVQPTGAGSKRVLVGELPTSLFLRYSHHDAWDSKIKELGPVVEQQLAECGWSKKARDSDDDRWRSPYEIMHKYLWVTHREL